MPITSNWREEIENVSLTPGGEQDFNIGSPMGRAGSVLARSAGVDDPSYRVEQSDAQSVGNAIEETLSERDSIRAIEDIKISGANQELEILTPLVPYEQPANRKPLERPTPQSPPEFEVDGKLKAARDTLAENLEASLDSNWGIEYVSVDFSPLGTKTVPASRALVRDRENLVESNVRFHNPSIELIRELKRQGKPHIIQTIIDKEGGSQSSLMATYRLAVFDSDQKLTTREDYERLIREGRRYDIADVFDHIEFTSNYKMDPRDFIEHEYGRYYLTEPKWNRASSGKEMYRLYAGVLEYRLLLAARIGVQEAYRDDYGYGHFSITATQMKNLLAMPAVYYDEDPFDGIPGRESPAIYTHHTVRETPGTKTKELDQLDVDVSASRVANAGSNAHERILEKARQTLLEMGRTLRGVKQDSSSMPDDVAEDTDPKVNVEADNMDVTKLAGVGVNTERALYQDREMLSATETSGDAEDVHAFLKRPFKGIVDGKAYLYNRTDPIRFDDGSFPIVRADQTDWYLTSDGRQEAYLDEDRIAEGDAEEPASTYEYRTPRARETDEGYEIIDQSGQTVWSGVSNAEFKRKWSRIYYPFIPSQLHYLSESEVWYEMGDRITKYMERPDWTQSEPSTQLQEGIRRFLERYTVAKEGAEIRYDRLREVYTSWHLAMLRIGDDPDDIEEHTPSPVSFGHAKPEYMETKQRSVDGTQKRFIRDRTLVYPIGLTDPDLPFVEEEEDDGGDDGEDEVETDTKTTDTDSGTETE